MEIKVKGLMCHHCEARLEKAIKSLGVTNCKADHTKGTLEFEENGIDLENIKEAILDAGFELEK